VKDRTEGRQGRTETFDVSRRALVTRLAAPLALAIPFSILAIRHPSADDATTIKSTPSEGTPAAFMEQAQRMRNLALETGDQGYGAVIVKDGRIVGQAPSRVVVNRDPTAHAEIEAIRDAARNLGTRDLSGCVMYGTSRACPMCEAAAYWANLTGMRFGSSVSDAGEPNLSRC
jgi:tRNA(Arg) A34 adenosine deaminase TadA